MDCQDVIAQLSDYLDKDAEKQLCEELERHFKDCPDCRVYVDTVKKMILLYRSERPLECPEEVRRKLHAALSYEYSKTK